MAVLVLLLSVALAALAARGRPAVTLAVLVGTVGLLPATLLLPGSPTGLLTASRLVLAGAVVGVVVAGRRGRLTRGALVPPTVALPLLAYLALLTVTGIVLADGSIDRVDAAYAWVGQAEQVVVLAVAVALGSALRARTVLGVLAVVAIAASAVALLEALTGTSWARALFAASPAQLAEVPAQPLEPREGGVRVRGAADFALAGGWLLVALLPAVAAAAHVFRRSRRTTLLLLAGLPAVAAAVVLTRGRSPLLGLVVVGVVLAAVLLPRRPAVMAGAVAAGLAGLVAAGPALLDALSVQVDSGSVDVRLERLPQVLALSADDPLTGAGLTGVAEVGLAGVDSSYLLTYVEAGALAAALLVLALAVALLSVLRGLRRFRRGDDDAALVLTCALGLAALLAAAVTFDLLTSLATSRLTWLLAGLGVAAAQRRAGPLRLPALREALRPERLLAATAAVVLATGVAAVVPERHAGEAVFATLDLRTEVADDPPGLGRLLVNTACGTGAAVSRAQAWTLTECAEQGPPGWGTLRVEAGSAALVERGIERVIDTAGAQPGLDRLRISLTAAGLTSGRPAAAQVAPYVVALLALAVLLLLPPAGPAPVTDGWVVNGRFLGAQVTGLQRTARSLLGAARDAGLAAEVLAPPGVDDPLVDRTVHVPTGRLGRRAAGHVFEQVGLPRAAAGRTVLSLTNTAPLRGRGVVLVHDLAPLVGPQWYAPSMRLYGLAVRAAARRAARVLTVSQTVAGELAAAGVDPARIGVVRPAVDPSFRPAAPEQVDALRAQLSLDRPYAVLVGWADPRKDLALAVAAHQRVLERGTPHDVVLVGRPHPTFAPVAVPDLPTVRRAGYLPDGGLQALLTGAAALLYPSRYEGFGLPPLEAWACGTPALVSDIPVLRETTGGAGPLLPPGDVAAWAAALQAALDGQVPVPPAPSRRWNDAARDLLAELGRAA